MAAAGWYPDPDGTPGRFRYWDGNQWSAATSNTPQAPPPGPTGPSAQRRQRGRAGLLIGGLAVLIVGAIVAALIVRALDDHHDTVLDDPDPPPSTASGWDDSSPLPTATPTPTPSKSARSPSPRSNPKVACAVGAPTERAKHPDNGRVYGGELSMPSPDSSWNHTNRDAIGLSFAYDVGLVDKIVEANWYESIAVGEVRTEDGFTGPEQAAEAITQCIASSTFYRGFQGRHDVYSKRHDVDGEPGWAVRTEIRVDDAGDDLEGDVSEAIVVDTGEQGTLSFFWGCVPIDDTARLEQLEAVMHDLRVS
ncbi:DUF2510 domain-containing protein [Microlunatus soli]|uniref:DUF2510 domain-containing protein n=1 Tax=Microlunatus soli TaxID=630515 RepID=A0A1H1Q4P4_9ACTN|nr:DUF2510 domain-containing protein [Microlunatus soli]SDS17939.1 Protein of unknown function [Microlunatus soli]